MFVFGRVAPTVPVRDIERALRFYRDVLGFSVTFTNGEPISFAAIAQGDARLHLEVQSAREGTIHFHLMVDDLSAVAEALRQNGVTLLQQPTVQPWGLQDLIVADLDGNSFEIAAPVR